jgi:hypothetical protein
LEYPSCLSELGPLTGLTLVLVVKIRSNIFPWFAKEVQSYFALREVIKILFLCKITVKTRHYCLILSGIKDNSAEEGTRLE